jgi:hypothetical protein
MNEDLMMGSIRGAEKVYSFTGTGTTVFEWTKTNRQPFNINIGKITR